MEEAPEAVTKSGFDRVQFSNCKSLSFNWKWINKLKVSQQPVAGESFKRRLLI